MDDYARLHKIFQLIRLLNTPPAKDVKQLVRRLDSSSSRVYEYLKLLERLGYKIQTDERHRKSLELSFPSSGKSVLEANDLAYLQEILQPLGGQSPQAAAILQKFNLNLSMIPLADVLPKLYANQIRQVIQTGIDNGWRLMLRRYRSLTSNTVEDRYVEPMEITPDYKYLIAWDLDKDRQSQFKLERIEDVDLLSKEVVTPGRIPSPIDIFGLTSDEIPGHRWHQVKLELSPLAHHLIVEEFPLSRQFIRSNRQPVIFDGIVRHWKGIGRFVLGLPGEIKVIDPPAFIDYLKKRRDNF